MATPVIRQTVAVAASGASATVTLGAGTASGDLLVVFDGNDFDQAANLPAPTTSQTVSNKTLQVTADPGTNESHLKVWTAGVTVSGSQTVSCAPTPSNEEVYNTTVVIDGSTVNLADFLDGTPAAGTSLTNTTSHVAPSVTTATSNALLLCGAMAGSGGATRSYTPDAAMTEQSDITDGTFCAESVDSQALTSSGATGTRTLTYGGSTHYATATIAIKGSSGGGQPVFGDAPGGQPYGMGGPGMQLVATMDGSMASGGTSAAAEATAVTVAAQDASVAASVNAEATSVAATATDALAAASVNAESTAVALTGQDATAAAGPQAEAAFTQVAAFDGSATVAATAGAGNAAMAAYDPTASIAANAESAAVVAFGAFDATVSTAAHTDAPAEATSVAVSSSDASAAVSVNAEATSVTVSAPDAFGSAGPNAQSAATVAFGAFDATVTTGTSAPAEAASAGATAFNASATLAANAGQAAAAAAAFDATVVAIGGVVPFAISEGGPLRQSTLDATGGSVGSVDTGGVQKSGSAG